MTTTLELDNFAQNTIHLGLMTDHVVETEKVRLMQKDLITCLVVKLEDDVALRCSVNGGRIRVTVGDSVVQIQSREWKRNDRNTAATVAWIDGYITGYKQ